MISTPPMDTTRRGNYDSGQDFVLEYGELRFTFNERDFAERCEQAALKVGFVDGRLNDSELEDLVNLVVNGRQEIRVNFEVRELQIAGVIRPQDISSTNTINYFKLAEARISYGGRGQITDMQQPRYGSQIADAILPF